VRSSPADAEPLTARAPLAPSRAARAGRGRRRRGVGEPSAWFVVPALAVYAVMMLYPSLSGAVYAFTDWSGLTGSRSFVGLENFRTLFSEDVAKGALRNTFLLTFFIVVVQNFIGLLLALGVHSAIKSRELLRVVFFTPVVVSPVIIAFLWKYLFSPAPDQGINALLGFFGLSFLQQDWLGDSGVALWSVGLTVVWQYAGFSMVIFLAALQTLPEELLDAASIDGAGRFARFRHVVLPLIAPAITINLMLSTIGGLKLFDQIFAITNGGPGYSTETLSTLIYKQAFVSGRYGYATAIALVLAIIVTAVSLVQLHYLRQREVTA
jgi:raffinose/stachyose/melibiose transport system permease protein